MTYTPEKPRLVESAEQLKARIPGWGVDLDPADRPAFPRERFDPGATGAHWHLPEQQPEKWPRERSMEHQRRTPVLGTSAPPKGLSGRMRKLAYARYTEAKAAHWLLLLVADRVDSKEEILRSILTTRPDNPITQTGILSERRRHGGSSRFGRNRVDVHHLWLVPIVVGGPRALGAWSMARVVRRLRRTG